MTAPRHRHVTAAAAAGGAHRASKRRVLIAAIRVRSGWTLVGDSGLVLLEGVPMHLDRNDVARDLERAVPGLEEVHHMHIWSLGGRRMLATLHAPLGASARADTSVAAIRKRLAAGHGIEHATVEVERAMAGPADRPRERAG